MAEVGQGIGRFGAPPERLTASVIVAAYQQPFSVPLLLMSLMAQKDAPPFEIIVCDDGSSSEMFEACRPVIEAATVPVSWVWQQDRGIRINRSRNNGIRQARGDYLIFMDGDMVPEEDFVAGHIAAHTKPKTIVLGHRSWRVLERAKEMSFDTADAALTFLRGTAAVDELSIRHEEREQSIRKRRFKHGRGWCVAAACSLSVDRLPEVVCDEAFLGYGGEDCEMAYRLVRLQGFDIEVARNVVAYHLQATVNDPTLSGSHQGIVSALRNVMYFAEKWPESQEEYGYFPLRRVRLDRQTDTWALRETPAEKQELPGLIADAREWLLAHNLG